MRKVRIPVYGTVGKSVPIGTSPAGATIGQDLRLPNGQVATLAQLQALFSTPSTSSSAVLWSLLQQIPANVLALVALAGSGIVVREPGGDLVVWDLGFQDLVDPGGQRLLYWDPVGETADWLEIGEGLAIVDGVLVSTSTFDPDAILTDDDGQVLVDADGNVLTEP